MRKNNRFIQEFIAEVNSNRATLVLSKQKKDFIIKRFCSAGMPIIEILRGSLPPKSGPTIVWPPEAIPEGYVITVTNENTYEAFKQICYAAVIISYGKTMVTKYEKYSDNFAFFLKKHSYIHVYGEQLLEAYQA